VVILMMTNRPDKLDTDLKRPGRFDLKIPFFFPETVAERASILGALARKNRLQTRPELRYEAAAEATAGYSSAELEAVMMAAANQAAEHDRTAIGEEDLSNAVRDVIPSRDTRMLEFMEMLAVFESSSRRMLPERYQGLDTEQVHARLDELRLSLRGRA
jgi:ATP-dependent 26S proteasome regulatory subunit